MKLNYEGCIKSRCAIVGETLCQHCTPGFSWDSDWNLGLTLETGTSKANILEFALENSSFLHFSRKVCGFAACRVFLDKIFSFFFSKYLTNIKYQADLLFVTRIN